MRRNVCNLIIVFLIVVISPLAHANEVIGKVKTLSGTPVIERSGTPIAAKLGGPVYPQDKIITDEHSAIGFLFNDDSRLSLGPLSTLLLEQFSFDEKSHDGNFGVSIQKGTLSVISGKLTAKTPGSLKVRTPAAILAVRGTEFSVKVDALGEEEEEQ
ncbi:MAG: FecR domain-containing protein [Cycloclasticus sp.]